MKKKARLLQINRKANFKNVKQNKFKTRMRIIIK